MDQPITKWLLRLPTAALFYRAGPVPHWTARMDDATQFKTSDLAFEEIRTYRLQQYRLVVVTVVFS